jgi:hypothetical protein
MAGGTAPLYDQIISPAFIFVVVQAVFFLLACLYFFLSLLLFFPLAGFITCCLYFL